MYLSKLELNGFKSFAARTVLDFDPGITAIVGPNGCGKSNVVDAVRWVIGEQRARILRSEKMENVIFNGTAKRRPLGMAEVQLTVENTRGVLPTEYSEVTLGRRLYRSGESEYLLNGTTCRLRDIVDLFMDTGMGAGAYSVIELKMIEEILSDNAQDRRHLFEEAAGITKYKQRRAQTFRKLDGTQADLARLRDLTDEIEHRVNSLKRQAARAARYRNHEDRLHELALTLAQVEYDRLVQQQQHIDTETGTLHDRLEEHTARMAKDEAELEALRKTLIDREKDLAQQQERLNEHLTAVHELEADLRLEQERLQGAQREHERTVRAQEEADQQRATLEEDIRRLSEELDASAPRLQETEDVLRNAKEARDRTRIAAEAQRKALHDLREREQETAAEHAEHLRRLDRLDNRIEWLVQERHRIHAEQKGSADELMEHDSRKEAAHVLLADAEAASEAARAALAETEEAHRDARSELEGALTALHRLEREHDAIQAEVQLLESLVSSFEAFSDAVRFLATEASWTPDAPRTVADVLACDAEYRAALDAALGDLASCLVVRSEDEARRAIALLRAERQGRATFLILDRISSEMLPAWDAGAPSEDGVRPLRDVVRLSDPTHAPAAALLLRNWFLVASPEQSHALAKASSAPACYVTEAGEWVDAHGLLHAGGARPDLSPAAARLGRREQLEAARERLKRIDVERSRQQAAAEALREDLDALPLDARRDAVEHAQHALSTAEQERARLAYERKVLDRRHAEGVERLRALDVEIADRQAEIEPLQATVAEAADRLDALRTLRESAEVEFITAESASQAAQERYREAHVAAVEARNRHHMLERDLARARHSMEALAVRSEARRDHLEALQRTIDAARQTCDRLRQEFETIRAQRSGLESAVSQAKTALLQTKVDIDKVEVRLRKLRQAREETIREENVRAVRRAEIHTRLEDLLASVEEEYDRSLAEDPVEVPDDFDAGEAREEVETLRKKLRGLGSVNPLALEDYETEKARFEFMSAQKEDLEAAEATLLETIDEINTTAAARFEETYEAIRTSFRSLFAELFGQDATADLSLADPNDPLESPIDIIAKPRGKRPIGISQLSSGEKTLTAIALLFAIYLVKPSPFCILDEVDAPLDDANIDRFMRLIRRFSEDTQFILVTHNKRTMELADRLYGITMQEQGVSRLVGVRFEEAMAMAE